MSKRVASLLGFLLAVLYPSVVFGNVDDNELVSHCDWDIVVNEEKVEVKEGDSFNDFFSRVETIAEKELGEKKRTMLRDVFASRNKHSGMVGYEEYLATQCGMVDHKVQVVNSESARMLQIRELFGMDLNLALPHIADDQISETIVKCGTWTPGITLLVMFAIKRQASEGQIFVDIGARTGYFTFLAAAMGARSIHAFETSPESAALLLQGVIDNDAQTQVHVHTAALGSGEESLENLVERKVPEQCSADECSESDSPIRFILASEHGIDEGTLRSISWAVSQRSFDFMVIEVGSLLDMRRVDLLNNLIAQEYIPFCLGHTVAQKASPASSRDLLAELSNMMSTRKCGRRIELCTADKCDASTTAAHFHTCRSGPLEQCQQVFVAKSHWVLVDTLHFAFNHVRELL